MKVIFSELQHEAKQQLSYHSVPVTDQQSILILPLHNTFFILSFYFIHLHFFHTSYFRHFLLSRLFSERYSAFFVYLLIITPLVFRMFLFFSSRPYTPMPFFSLPIPYKCPFLCPPSPSLSFNSKHDCHLSHFYYIYQHSFFLSTFISLCHFSHHLYLLQEHHIPPPLHSSLLSNSYISLQCLQWATIAVQNRIARVASLKGSNQWFAVQSLQSRIQESMVWSGVKLMSFVADFPKDNQVFSHLVLRECIYMSSAFV